MADGIPSHRYLVDLSSRLAMDTYGFYGFTLFDDADEAA
jgi:hypothetical protein